MTQGSYRLDHLPGHHDDQAIALALGICTLLARQPWPARCGERVRRAVREAPTEPPVDDAGGSRHAATGLQPARRGEDTAA